jgi:hypothetical protein
MIPKSLTLSTGFVALSVKPPQSVIPQHTDAGGVTLSPCSRARFGAAAAGHRPKR